MVGNLTVIIPFYNGHQYIERLVASIPQNIPVLIVDDKSEETLYNRWNGANKLSTGKVAVLRPEEKGYFSGAVNVGIQACETDVLVLNQDTWFDNDLAFGLIDDLRNEGYAMIGERIRGDHPAFGSTGYIHGTFMFLRRDAIEAVGLLNDQQYPLWGATAEYQWRVARRGYSVKPVGLIPGFHHERPETERYGSSIKGLLDVMPTSKKERFVKTPPLLSVIIPCYNYGRYVSDAVSSLIGGNSSLGTVVPQSLQSFEVIIVDDASTDRSWEKIQALVSETKGIRAYRLEKNKGTAGALNYGIEKAVGKYITFLSADDMREPDSLLALVRACEANPHSFAYDDIMLFARNRKVKQWKMGEYDFEALLYKNHIHAGIVFPREAWVEVGGYPEIMKDGREDWAFNVALGIKGWCGIHLPQFGYLYRRENHNRSLTNTSPEHHERFLRKISGLFPEVYEGYRPTMCCGKKPKKGSPGALSQESLIRKSGSTNNINGGSYQMAKQAGVEGMVMLVYAGRQQPAVWDGGVTNTRYRFGIGKERGWVDVRDAGYDANEPTGRGKKGFLSLKDSQGAWLFNAEGQESPQVKQKVASKSVMPQATVIVSGSPDPAATPQNVSMVILDEVVEEDVAEDEGTEGMAGISPADFNAKEIMGFTLTPAEWRDLYEKELKSEKPRKSLITWLEEKLASE